MKTRACNYELSCENQSLIDDTKQELSVRKDLAAYTVRLEKVTGQLGIGTSPYIRLRRYDIHDSDETVNKSKVVVPLDEKGYICVSSSTNNNEHYYYLPTCCTDFEVELWDRRANEFNTYVGSGHVSISQMLSAQNRKNPKHNAINFMNSSLTCAIDTSKTSLSSASSLIAHFKVSFLTKLDVMNCEHLDDPTKELLLAGQYAKILSDYRNDNIGSDASFELQPPHIPIEWAHVVSTSIRHIFFHSDIDQLSNFHEYILYGILVPEANEEEIIIDETHRKAFQLCQWAAQYMNHNIESLKEHCSKQKKHVYESKCKRKDLQRTHRQLKHTLEMLRKENSEMDKMTITYECMLNSIVKKKSSTTVQDISTELASIVNPSIDCRSVCEQSELNSLNTPNEQCKPACEDNKATELLLKKPILSKSFEEIEKDRRVAKEANREVRIHNESERLKKSIVERRKQQEIETAVSKMQVIKQKRKIRQVKNFLRRQIRLWQHHKYETRNHAAITIQKIFRGSKQRKTFTKEMCGLQSVDNGYLDEQNKMAEEDLLLTGELLLQTTNRDSRLAFDNTLSLRITDDADSDLLPIDIRHEDVVSLWQFVRESLVKALQKRKISLPLLFKQLDRRRDNIIDRLEFREAIYNLRGVLIDRKLIRRLISFLRVKCHDSSQPYQLSYKHVRDGFNLAEDKQLLELSELEETT